MKLLAYSQRCSMDEHQILELHDEGHRFSSLGYYNLLVYVDMIMFDNTHDGEIVVAGVHADPGAAGD